jgi:hypothetical protein
MKKLLVIIALFFLAGCNQASDSSILTNDYDQLFRQNHPDNILGNLSKPSKMYFDSSHNIFALSTEGKRVALELSDKIFENTEYDRYKDGSIFFDKANDRIYFIENNRVKYYDINDQKIITTNVPVRPKQEREGHLVMPNKEDIAGAYGDYVVLESRGDYGKDSQFHSFNVNTGKKSSDRAWTTQNEYKQSYQLFLDEKGYKLILDSKTNKSFPVMKTGGLYRRTVESSEESLGIYLKENDYSYEEWIEDQPKTIEEMLRTTDFKELQEQEENHENATLLLEVKTNLPEHVNSSRYQRTFKIRNLFKVDENRLALEIDNSIALIDFESFEANLIEDPGEIENFLKDSILLAPPTANNFDFGHEAYCEQFSMFNEESITENDIYISCLE